MKRIEKLTSQLRVNKTLNVEPIADETTHKCYVMWEKALRIAFDHKIEQKQREKQYFAILDDLFIEDIIFKAPTYWKTRKGKLFAKYALLGVSNVFKNFKYTRKWLGHRSFALEFECRIGEEGPNLRGIDLITINDIGQITEIEIMARPPNAVKYIEQKQAEFLRSRKIIK